MGDVPLVESVQMLDEMNNATMCASANHSTCTLDIVYREREKCVHSTIPINSRLTRTQTEAASTRHEEEEEEKK